MNHLSLHALASLALALDLGAKELLLVEKRLLLHHGSHIVEKRRRAPCKGLNARGHVPR
jgi:hypothetical protein